MTISRRAVLVGGASAPLAACATGTGIRPSGPRIIVVGAGVFGAWTAEHLRRTGADVLLVDQTGAAHSRASSGGESRMIRASYGKDRIYSEMALASLPEWLALSDANAPPLFHPCGVLEVFDGPMEYADQSIAVHEALGHPLEQLDPDALAARWPQMSFDGVAYGLFEPEFGALMARRGVDAVVRRFVAKGGKYRIAHAAPNSSLGNVANLNGEDISADAVIYACGPWLKTLFPDVLGERLFVTRQEIAYVATPDGDDSFEPQNFPGWADINSEDVYYGFPSLEARGFKLARDTHGPAFDPDSGDRDMTETGKEELRAFLGRRFPALADQPFTEFRVCQYTGSSNGDFLLDRHPTLDGTYLLGAGSGHGFKHGPEIGRMMAELVLNPDRETAQRFSLATKGTFQSREVL